jgi:hypothetical protein
MSSTHDVSFVSWCPKGHSPTLIFIRENLLSALEDDSLRFWCNLCGDYWQPNEEEKRRIKDRFSSDSHPYLPDDLLRPLSNTLKKSRY